MQKENKMNKKKGNRMYFLIKQEENTQTEKREWKSILCLFVIFFDCIVFNAIAKEKEWINNQNL